MLIKMLTMIMLYLQYVFTSNQTYQIPHTGINTCLVVKVYCNSGLINPAIEVIDTVRDGKHGTSLGNNTPEQNDIAIDEEETEVTNMINECLNSENFVSVVDTLIRQRNNEQVDILSVPHEPETNNINTCDKSLNSVDKTALPSKQLESPNQLTSAKSSCSSSHKLIQHIKKKNLKSAKDRKMRQKVQEMINERLKVDQEQECIDADDKIDTDAGLMYEHKEKYFKRWDEILLAKGDKRLINLFNNLKLSYQPEKQKSFIDFIKNTAKFNKTFNGYNFQYKVISGYRIDDIMEVIGKPKIVTNVWNILLDDDEDKAFTYEELSTKICVDINYYIAAVKYKCFNLHANGNYLLPKISIYNIIEFVPEFFCYFIYKIFCIKNVKYTTEFGYHLKSELDNVYKLLEKFDCFCNKPICTELTRLLMINEFRKNVLTYLKNYHNDDTVWIVYELCTIAAHEEHLKSISGSLFLCLSLCFTFDFTPAKASLQTFYRKICIKKRSVVKTKMVRIYLGTKLLGFRSIAESALFTLIEMQEQNLELLFGHKNTTRIYLPNNDFVLFVNIDSADSEKTEIYAIRKHELGVILLHGNLQFAPGLISPC